MELNISPKQAAADFRWLSENGYWDHFSFYLMSRRHWQPMTSRFFLTEMGCRMKFRRGSKPYNLAVALREAREAHMKYLETKDNG